MNSERCCVICQIPLIGKQLRFCSRKHAMKWHNSQQDWYARKDRHRKNAARKARYRADPAYWANKAAEWRKANPEKAALIAQHTKQKHWTSPWRTLVTNAKQRAKKKNLQFDLTFEWAQARWTGFCELTRIPFSPRYNASCGIFSPSIDRILQTKGYTQDNCRFVLVSVNGLKSDGTDEAMYMVAEALMAHKSDQKAAPPMLNTQAPDTLLAVTTS